LVAVFVLGLWAAFLIWITLQKRADSERALSDFAMAASKLGFDRDGTRARGRLDLPVELTLLPSWRVRVTVAIEPPLAMGIRIRERNAATYRPTKRLHPSFDAAFTLEALDLAQAIDLCQGDVARLLCDAESMQQNPEVHDDAVRLCSNRLAPAERIVATVRRANDIAVQMISRRPLLSPANIERAFGKALIAVGRTLDAEVDPRTGLLEQRSDVGLLSVRIVRSARGAHSTRFGFTFARPLSDELELSDERERSSLDRVLYPDIQTGDAMFDAAFVVRAESAERANGLVGPSAKNALLALRRHVRALRLDQDGIEASLPVALGDARKLGNIVEALRAVGEAFGERRTARAYR
jgi:hypothetical protein